ncbi:RNA cytidine acetyltransferase 1, partial [Cucurbita argyrosperma subsp. argyrosperma]
MILLQIPLEPHEITVDDDLKEGAKQVEEKMKMKNEGSLDVGMLQQYAIVDGEVDFDGALPSGGKIPSGGVVSVKSNKTKAEKQVKKKEKEQSSRKRSKDDGFKSNKKKKA